MNSPFNYVNKLTVKTIIKKKLERRKGLHVNVTTILHFICQIIYENIFIFTLNLAVVFNIHFLPFLAYFFTNHSYVLYAVLWDLSISPTTYFDILWRWQRSSDQSASETRQLTLTVTAPVRGATVTVDDERDIPFLIINCTRIPEIRNIFQNFAAWKHHYEISWLHLND